MEKNMENFGGLPLEVVDIIFLKLDKESILNASKVCIQWKKVIHNLSSLESSVTEDPVLMNKLEKCGLILREHDVENCRCIEVNVGLFRFIGNPDNQMVCEELENRYLAENDYIGFRNVVSKSKLCVATNYSSPINEDTNMVYITDLTETEERIEPIEIKIHEEIKENDALYDMELFACDNTLVILRDCEEEMISDETILYKKIHLWNLKSLDHVSDLNFVDVVKRDAANNGDITFVGVDWLNVRDNKLAVKLFFDLNGQRIFQTHFWKLNTLSPSAENIHHWTKLDENLNHWMHMNSKFICGRFETQPEIKLKVWNFEDLTKVSLLDTGLKQCYQFICVEKLEEGLSNKFAIFIKYDWMLQVYDLNSENTSFEFQIDFSAYIGDNDYSLTLASFFLGKMMLVKTFYDSNEQEYLFSFIIVNEDGDVIDGNTQKYEGYFDKEEAFIDQDASYHIDINGVLVYTNKHDIYKYEYSDDDEDEDEEEFKIIHFYH